MKYRFISDHRFEFGVEKMCRVLKVSRSGYYSWRGRGKSVRQLKNKRLLGEITESYERNRKVYGSPRITEDLLANGIECSENRVARLMRINGIAVEPKRKFKVSTDSRHSLPVAENLLKQDFTADAPDRVWVSDITYIWTTHGWLYLAVILDLFSRKVVGWSMSELLTQEIVTDALIQAIWRRKPKAGLIFHSDRGSQYASKAFRDLLGEYSFLQSMSGKGNCYDNAVAESFFHTLKTEEVYLGKYDTRSEARQSVFDYIEMFYNRTRRHSTLGYLSPFDFEEMANAA